MRTCKRTRDYRRQEAAPMKVLFEATIRMEYDLREGETIEELTGEVIDQIKNGEYFPSRVKDVQVTSMPEAS